MTTIQSKVRKARITIENRYVSNYSPRVTYRYMHVFVFIRIRCSADCVFSVAIYKIVEHCSGVATRLSSVHGQTTSWLPKNLLFYFLKCFCVGSSGP